MHPAKRYIENVTKGKILTCDFVKLAVSRHVKDLKEGKKRGLYFDESAAQKVIDFFHILNHYEGEWAGTQIHLEDWQQFILWVAYGWKREDGTRRFRNGYIEVARKNGKSTLLGGLALYGLMLDDESAPQIYCGATKVDQATIVVNIAGKIAQGTPHLEKRLRFQEHLGVIKRVIYEPRAGFIAPLGRDSKTQDGFNPHMGIMDERHAMPTDDVPNVVKSGMGARKQPFQWSITTAGVSKEYPCYKLRKTLIEILKGLKQDDSTFGIVYTLDNEEKEWNKPKAWIKANPNYGISCKASFLNDEYIQAVNEGGTTEVNFKTKNLNLWSDSSKTWIQDEVWVNLQQEFPELAESYGGLDLGSTSDFNALSLVFPVNGKMYLKTIYWIPEETINNRNKESVNIPEWVKNGWVRTTPGNITDYDFIERDILELKDRFNIKSIAFDRYYAIPMVGHLTDKGINMTPFGQGFISMSMPTKELERLALSGGIVHDGNPVTRWMMRNVMILMNPAGDIKIDKSKSHEKVDGPVSAVMALGEQMTAPKEVSTAIEIW